MSRSHLLKSIAAATCGIMLLGACGGLTERAAEFGLEQAADGNQDIDLDFGGDGGFNITTEEGSFGINLDEDNGTIVFNSDEGDAVINFDEDNGAVTFESDDGDGSLTLASTETPAQWPAWLGTPQTTNQDETFFSVLDVGTHTVISAIFDHAPNDPYAAQAKAAFGAMGWTITAEGEDSVNTWAAFASGENTAQLSADENGFTAITINLANPQ